ncbi:hypothetical protein [Xenorhabdus indica]|uniref:hypothetical protein n=1 Tax=Xenorhabdus indica TaxID=333964 RepID=UPI0016570149|nr:hypothetical protein [Xenorhabdus indica]MBC8946915.1 hypothetical protein [Xenorhabdus indica]
MTSDYWRSPRCYVPKDPVERWQYLRELVAASKSDTPHPAISTLPERVHNECIGQLNHQIAVNPPLPRHMAEQRAEQERQAWRDYWATHQREHDHYRGDSPRRHHGGIWTGD